MPRNVTDPPRDPRERFALYRLCDCPICEGRGQLWRQDDNGELSALVPIETAQLVRCSECRGEGRIRQEIASCETPEAVGVALVTLAREGEWTDANGDPCAFGLLDREGEKGQKWLILPWQASPRNVRDAARTLARSKKR